MSRKLIEIKDSQSLETQVSDQEISRREFLDLVRKIGVPAIFLTGILSDIYFALSIPGYDQKKDMGLEQWELVAPELTVRPRWPILNYKNGPADYIRQMVSEHIGVNKAFFQGYRGLFEDKPGTNSFSEIFGRQMSLSAVQFRNNYPLIHSRKSAWERQAATLGMTFHSLAGIFSSYFSIHELSALGVNVPERVWREKPDKGRFNIWSYLPQVFPLAVGDGVELTEDQKIFTVPGHDRAVHLIQHAWIVFNYLRFSYTGLQDAKRMPGFVWAKIRPEEDDLEGQALELSNTVGEIWEWKETLDLILWPNETYSEQAVAGSNNGVTTGRNDLAYKLDLLANYEGFLLGWRLFERVILRKHPYVDDILLKLDSDRITRPQNRIEISLEGKQFLSPID